MSFPTRASTPRCKRLIWSERLARRLLFEKDVVRGNRLNGGYQVDQVTDSSVCGSRTLRLSPYRGSGIDKLAFRQRYAAGKGSDRKGISLVQVIQSFSTRRGRGLVHRATIAERPPARTGSLNVVSTASQCPQKRLPTYVAAASTISPPHGASADEALRREVHDAELLIGLSRPPT